MSNPILDRTFKSIPDGWRVQPISEALLEVDQPINMRNDELYQLVSVRRRNGGLFYRESLKGSHILTKTLRWVVPKTFVVARMQVVHGATAFVSDDFAGSAVSKSYSSFAGTDICDAEFFSWMARLPFMYAYFMDSSQGIVIEKMTFDQNRWLSLPVPLPPLTEQRKITEILCLIDEQIRNSEEIIAKLKLVKTGLSTNLFDRTGWKLRPLGDVADIKNGTTPSRARADYWTNGSIPWLASGKVNDYIVSQPSEYVTGRAFSDCGLTLLPVGSVVVGMIGDGKTRGMSARLAIASAINQNLAGILPGRELDGAFLHQYLVHSYDRLRGGGRGSNQDALNTSLVSEFLVPVPTQFEQSRVVQLLDTVDVRAAAEKANRQKLDSLLHGVMSDLLTGCVRVPVEVAS
jgi:type I restriction enzyme S subunit